MKILVTGSAGFIGSATSIKLLDRGDQVIGIDNHNNYYDPAIKKARVKRKKKYSNYNNYKLDLCNKNKLENILKFINQKLLIILLRLECVFNRKPLSYINN